MASESAAVCAAEFVGCKVVRLDMAKPLRQLLADVDYRIFQGNPDVEVDSIYYDSRECAPGGLFFCIRGFNLDGHDFVSEAVARGARVLVVERKVSAPQWVTVVEVEDTRRAMGLMSSAFFDRPSGRLNITGVTGTNGKTSVSFFVDALLRESGYGVGLLGTVENRIGGEVLPVKRTTPESLDLQSLFARMLAAGCTHVSMEVSSHAVDLERIAGTEFKAGIFTNLTQDHLDFHKDFESYRDAKKRFFSEYLKGDAVGIINADDGNADYMTTDLSCRVITYGIEDKDADVRAEAVQCGVEGIGFKVVSGGHELGCIETRLMGHFNVYNVLAMAAFAVASEIPFEYVGRVMNRMQPVPGRFERVEEGQDFAVVVDYAHTPDGLENVLKSAKGICRGKLFVVFGAGGDRDRSKRPIMGRAAASVADVVIITSDNPRTESPAAIIADIIEGVEEEIAVLPHDKKPKYMVEQDRFRAITTALTAAAEGDVVVIAGKGHETYQIFKDRTIHFDDREVARSILRERFSGKRSVGTDSRGCRRQACQG
ncbi:MAG: UDP-N-acetylmuramoyl-L-alanyl-D-glutamate--2,6-diaminopimelate ligase [bacterium]